MLLDVIIASSRRRKVYLLDIAPAALAYGLRRLSSTYSGQCIRVRRSSDNAQQDIGFTGNDIDQSALESFCASTNGFVVTLYDQSGNGHNVTQATAGGQPQIVSSGSMLTQSSRASMTFGADAILNFPSGAAGTFRNKSQGEILASCRNTVTNARRDVGGFHVSGSVLSRFSLIFGNVTANRFTVFTRRLDEDAANLLTATTDSSNNFAVFAGAADFAGNTREARQNGTVVATGTGNGAGNTSDTDSNIGTTSNSSGIGKLFGSNPVAHISDFIVYNTDVSATKADRDAELLAYYGL